TPSVIDVHLTSTSTHLLFTSLFRSIMKTYTCCVSSSVPGRITILLITYSVSSQGTSCGDRSRSYGRAGSTNLLPKYLQLAADQSRQQQTSYVRTPSCL